MHFNQLQILSFENSLFHSSVGSKYPGMFGLMCARNTSSFKSSKPSPGFSGTLIKPFSNKGFLIPVTFILIAVATVINSQKAKSTFYAISGVAAISLLLFQSMLNIFGVTDLLPLTGVTLPFISKGGSSIICCFCLLAFIKSVDVRTFSNFKPDLARTQPKAKGKRRTTDEIDD